MSSLLISGLLVFVLSSFNFVLVNAIQCYGCNGEYCNDPLNKDKATIINCSYNSKLNRNAEDISGGNEITSSKFLDLQSLENKLMSLFFNWNTEYVCVKSSYFNSVHQTTMTIRRCMPKNYKNRDACAQLSNTINSGYGTVRNCMSCNTSLCNSASSLTKGVLTVLLLTFIKSFI